MHSGTESLGMLVVVSMPTLKTMICQRASAAGDDDADT